MKVKDVELPILPPGYKWKSTSTPFLLEVHRVDEKGHNEYNEEYNEVVALISDRGDHYAVQEGRGCHGPYKDLDRIVPTLQEAVGYTTSLMCLGEFS